MLGEFNAGIPKGNFAGTLEEGLPAVVEGNEQDNVCNLRLDQGLEEGQKAVDQIYNHKVGSFSNLNAPKVHCCRN